ncbi:hypothetical protein JCM11491_003361 [Sporobolomyces phaffii]
MSDSNVTDISSTASTPQEDKWTYIASGGPLSPSARSATSASTSRFDDGDELGGQSNFAVAPSSPAQSLVESEHSEPKLEIETDEASPLATPLPASPSDEVQEESNLSTPKDTTWARSRTSISVSEGGADPANPADDTGDDHQESRVSGDELENATIPSLTFTKATMSPRESEPEEHQAPSKIASQEEEEDDGEQTDVPPLVNRIDTKLAPSFVTDADQLYASPTFTNNAAPNSAVSPKTASFFATNGHRSPPRAGGAMITELPSDVDTADELQALKAKPAAISAQPRVEEEDEDQEEDDEPEKAGSSSKTMPLISPRHSSDGPTPRGPYTFGRQYVSTFSREPSPAPRPRPERAPQPRPHDHRPRRGDKPSSAPRMPTHFVSRTYVSASRSQARQPLLCESVNIEQPLSMRDLVDKVKQALSTDSTAYYTLKGVLVEHEELKRRSPSHGRRREGPKDEVPVGCRDENLPLSGYVVKEEDKEEKLTPRRYRHSFKPRHVPVKSVSLTQTDTESEAESPIRRRQDEVDFVVRRAQQGSRGVLPVPLRAAPQAQAPVDPTRRTAQSQLARPPVAPVVPILPASTGAKSSVLKCLKLVSPVSEAAGEAASRPEHDARLRRFPSTPPKSTAAIARRRAPNLGSSTSALQNLPDLQPAPSPSYPSRSRIARHPCFPSSAARQANAKFPCDLDLGRDGQPVLLVNYLRPRPTSERRPASSICPSSLSKSGPLGRARQAEQGLTHKSHERKRKRVNDEEAEAGTGVRKGEGKERENSISFDFDDFF